MMIINILPMNAFAANREATPSFLQIDNGYLTIRVSTANGGFLIDTVEGDKITKSDNNKFLL